MISSTYTIKRYDADEGNVFDWKNLDEHIVEVDDDKTAFIVSLDEDGNEIVQDVDESEYLEDAE